MAKPDEHVTLVRDGLSIEIDTRDGRTRVKLSCRNCDTHDFIDVKTSHLPLVAKLAVTEIIRQGMIEPITMPLSDIASQAQGDSAVEELLRKFNPPQQH